MVADALQSGSEDLSDLLNRCDDVGWFFPHCTREEGALVFKLGQNVADDGPLRLRRLKACSEA